MKRLFLWMALALIALGCSPAQHLRFRSEDIQKTILRPAHCQQQPDGSLKCSDVTVVLKTIPAK